MHDNTRAGTVPLLVFGMCGIAGVGTDAFSGIALLIDGPAYLHKLEPVVAILCTIPVCYMVARTIVRQSRSIRVLENRS